MTTIGEHRGASAAEIASRARAIRQHVVRMVGALGEGYVAQGLGAAGLLATLYFSELRLDPADPRWPDRDRCVYSAAHNSAGLYAALAERGVVPVAELAEYGRDGSSLEIIAPEEVPGVEGTFGSLGQGLSVGVGLALSGRRQGRSYRVYVVLGDGELQEGQTWEAAMAAASYELDSLCAIVDLNGMQVEGAIDRVLRMGAIGEKWAAFGWAVQEVDGHDVPALLEAFARARATRGRPSVLIARTVPGRDVSFLEGRLQHYAKLPPEAAAEALRELGARR